MLLLAIILAPMLGGLCCKKKSGDKKTKGGAKKTKSKERKAPVKLQPDAPEMVASSKLKLNSGRELLYADACAELKGGSKEWECMVDLCNYIDKEEKEAVRGMKVLELECGAAMPSVLCVKMGASHVTVNDYDESVFERYTKESFSLNDVSNDKYTTIAGRDWSSLSNTLASGSFDLILTSETIYFSGDYESQHNALNDLLSPGGRVLIAARSACWMTACTDTGCYRGSLHAFENFVKEKGVFTSNRVWSFNPEKSNAGGSPREILMLSRKSKC